MAPLETHVDLGEMMTDLARQAQVQARRKGLILLYDYEGTLDSVDVDEPDLRALVQRSLGHALRRSSAGFVFFGTEVRQASDGRCLVSCQIASNAPSAGAPALPAEIVEFPCVSWETFWRTGKQANLRGRSQVLDAQVSLVAMEGEGEVVHLDIGLPLRAAGRPSDSADARGERVWLIADPPLAAAALTRRLQRLGWRAHTFSTTAEARAALAHNEDATLPRLIIGLASYRVGIDEFARLAHDLPASTLGMLAAGEDAASAVQRHRRSAPFELILQPVGPAQLLDITQRLAATSESARSGTTLPAALSYGDRCRVLVVDDNNVNQLLAREMLQLLGYEVTLADDGLQAIAQCKQQSPHAILMDINMPELDGLRATRELRLLQRRGSIGKFAIIGHTADAAAREQCLAAGMDEFLPKPIMLPELERLLVKVLA
jgi:CheY-like chemotaxis protein